MTDSSLQHKFNDYKAANPKARIRDVATALGVSELELLLLDSNLTRLDNIPELFARLGELGEVMALTRNEFAVHERTGTYETMHDMGPRGTMALFLGSEIDLRIFFRHIKHAYALAPIESPQNPGARASLQFFDKDGTAVHKVFIKSTSSIPAFEKLRSDFSAGVAQDYVPTIKPVEDSRFNTADSAIDSGKLCEDWDNLKDIHDFFPMLKRYKVEREQALRLVGSERAYQVAPEAVEQMFTAAAASALPIMCFVGSHGVIQIFVGEISNIKTFGDWLNIMDERFTLHLENRGFARVWVVKKPSVDGIITALECYSADGTLRVQFFGKRETSQAENPKWRELVNSLPKI